MTQFDRIEGRLPDLLSELAAARVPDYFDDMLRQTVRTRQRPAWSSLERWLPVDITAQSARLRVPGWRPLAFVALVLLAIAAVALFAAGSQRRLPQPFGPARNGAILYSTTAGDIHSIDPASGVAHPIMTGSAVDNGPLLSRDGTRFLFVRTGNGSTNALFVANVDGSGARQLFEGQFGMSTLIDGLPHPAPAPFSWSPDGRHVAITSTIDEIGKLTLVATDGSGANTLDLGMSASDVTWRPNGQLVFLGTDARGPAMTYGLYVVNPDGTGMKPILPPNALAYGWQSPAISPDGSRVAFARWGDPLGDGIHIATIDSGLDRVLDFEGQIESDEYLPQFSPDGTKLMFARFLDHEYQLAVVPVGGGGRPIEMGPRFSEATDGPFLNFSPDGTVILATYPADSSTWLLDTEGGTSRKVSWPEGQYFTWQRLAP
jgi:Tol biopolymer transport system component